MVRINADLPENLQLVALNGLANDSNELFLGILVFAKIIFVFWEHP